jgi:hypothetical protein
LSLDFKDLGCKTYVIEKVKNIGKHLIVSAFYKLNCKPNLRHWKKSRTLVII